MGYRFFILLAALLLGGALVGYLLSDIVIYLLTSLIISSILKPAVNLLNHLEVFGFRLPRWIAVTITMVGVAGSITYGLITTIPVLVDQANALSKSDLTAVINKINKPILRIEQALNDGGIIKVRPGYFKRYLREFTSLDIKMGDFGHYIENLITITSSIFVTLLAVSFMTFFLLLERGLLKKAILKFVPNAFFELTITAFYKIERLLSSYLLGLATQITAIFLLSLFGYWLLGMQYIVTIALFAAVINVLPYIGPLLGNITAIIVGLVTTPGITEDQYLSYGTQILAVGLIVHLIDNVALQPMIFSRNLKAHPLEIFVAIFAGSSIGGIVGMVVALPVYTVIRVTISEISDGYRAYRIFKVRSKAPSLTTS